MMTKTDMMTKTVEELRDYARRGVADGLARKPLGPATEQLKHGSPAANAYSAAHVLATYAGHMADFGASVWNRASICEAAIRLAQVMQETRSSETSAP